MPRRCHHRVPLLPVVIAHHLIPLHLLLVDCFVHWRDCCCRDGVGRCVLDVAMPPPTTIALRRMRQSNCRRCLCHCSSPCRCHVNPLCHTSSSPHSTPSKMDDAAQPRSVMRAIEPLHPPKKHVPLLGMSSSSIRCVGAWDGTLCGALGGRFRRRRPWRCSQNWGKDSEPPTYLVIPLYVRLLRLNTI